LRELHLNGYIDDDVWFGDEITPEGLHEVLYGEENEFSDDVHIRLNSFGGSCNAATRMYDDIRAYPGNVHITVSGTAASAATVLAMAADRLEMTPGSLWMIHDPSIIAWGNERDLTEAIGLLRACKESILNIYAVRCKKGRGDLAAMMTATSWMDAKAALAEGFIDGIAEDMNVGLSKILNHRSVDIVEAEAKVKAWLDRRRLQPSRPEKGDDHTSFVPSGNDQTTRPEEQGEAARSTPEQIEQPEIPGTPIAQLQKRLGLLMPARRSS
jgi:ATP-dependent Clp protease protease subunit